MDPLSINPIPGAPTTQQPATVAATFVASKAPTSVVAPKPIEAERKKTVPAPEADMPPRDSRSVQYQVQDNRVITTIVDDNSKKVVVQIPDAELIRIAKSIDRMQGFFIEQKA